MKLLRTHKRLLTHLKGALGNISFTTDIWSDSNLKSYLAMTGHWISEDPTTKVLHLECALIAFHRLRDRHMGESLANTILYLLDRMNVTDKVRTLSSALYLDV